MHTPLDYAAVFGVRNKIIRGPCFDLLRGNSKGGCVVGGNVAEGNVSRTDDGFDTAVVSLERVGYVGPRLGLIVPKKLARRAVLRNTIKRQIRESFRHCDQSVLPSVDLVFRLTRWPRDVAMYVTTPAVLKQKLRQEIDQLLMKLVRLPELSVSAAGRR